VNCFEETRKVGKDGEVEDGRCVQIQLQMFFIILYYVVDVTFSLRRLVVKQLETVVGLCVGYSLAFILALCRPSNTFLLTGESL
jgi:hypothetical protein